MKELHYYLLLSALFLSPTIESASAALARPNVLFIAMDDLSDWVGCLGGHPQTKTPNLTRLRDSGVSFHQAHCTSPICAPSRASFLTGLYPHTSRNYGFDKWFDNEVLKNSRTLMDHFRAKGYHTLGTGKLMHQEIAKEWSEWGNDVGLYDHANDPHEWTNLAGNPEHAARLAIFRQQLAQRLPAAADNPAPQKTDVSRRSEAKTDAEAWKDKFFKQHPDADTNKDGVLSWPEYKAYKAKLDAKKAKNKPQP